MVSEGPPSRRFSESGRYDADGAKSKGCMSVPWKPKAAGEMAGGARRCEMGYLLSYN